MRKIIPIILLLSVLLTVPAYAFTTFGTKYNYIAMYNRGGAGFVARNTYFNHLPQVYVSNPDSSYGSHLAYGKYYQVLQPGLYHLQLDMYTSGMIMPGFPTDGILDPQQDNIDFYLWDMGSFVDPGSLNDMHQQIWDKTESSTKPFSQPLAQNIANENYKLRNLPYCTWRGYLTKTNSQSYRFDMLIYLDERAFEDGLIFDKYLFLYWYQPTSYHQDNRINAWDFYDVNSDSHILSEIYSKLDDIAGSAGGSGLDERAVHDAVLSALNDFDDQERSVGNAAVDDVQDFMGGHTRQYADSLNVLMATMDAADDIFTSNSKTMQLTFPAAQLPQLSGVASGGTMWAAQTIDFSDAIDAIPDQLMQVVRLILDVGVYFAILRTIIKLIQWILDVNNPDLDIGWWEIL